MDIQEGSYGGRPGKDGLDAVDTLYANTRNNPVEDIESHYPLRVTRYELNVDTRPGRWRGGLGTVREIEFLAPGGSRQRAPASAARIAGAACNGCGVPITTASILLSRSMASTSV
jgi:N-methylhydantoinase B/oxoprolinase/acetone carboxylase alpha subunit